MADTEKFELEISMEATITVFDDAHQPVDWIKPGSRVSHTWRGMPTLDEMELRYNAMVPIVTETLKDGLVNARARAVAARQGK